MPGASAIVRTKSPVSGLRLSSTGADQSVNEPARAPVFLSVHALVTDHWFHTATDSP